MEHIIRTENVAKFIADYFILKDDYARNCPGCSLINEETKDEVLISTKNGLSGLSDGDTLTLHIESTHNKRIKIYERLTYSISTHDSVSVAGTLIEYNSGTTNLQ